MAEIYKTPTLLHHQISFLHSLFSKVDVKLNGHQVCPMNDYVYPYRAMLETLLSYGDEIKRTNLQSEPFYKDTDGAMEDMKHKSKNKKFPERYRYCKNNEDIEMTGRLHHDIFQQDRL